MAFSENAGHVESGHTLQFEPSASLDSPGKLPDRPSCAKEHNKIGSHWLGLESRQDSGLARESGTDVSVLHRDDPQDTDCTGSKAAEQRTLLHMDPRRKPRRRPPPPSRYDQLVLLAEQNAQHRHDALYGPSLGAGLDRAPEAAQRTPAVDSSLDLHAMD